MPPEREWGWAISVSGEDFFADGRLGFKPIPQTKKNPFYLLISKNYAQGEELKRILDAGITKMKISGKLRELIGKYVPE